MNKSDQCSFYPSPIIYLHKIKNRELEVFFPQRGQTLLRAQYNCFKIQWDELFSFLPFSLPSFLPSCGEILVFKLQVLTLLEAAPTF